MDRISGLNSFSINSASVYQQHNQNPIGSSDPLSESSNLSLKNSNSFQRNDETEISNDFQKVQQEGQTYSQTNNYSSNPRLRAYQQVSKMGSGDARVGISLSV